MNIGIRQHVVAVVDDDPSMLKSLDRLLKANKFKTATFSSAEAFLAGGGARTADCLVLDVHLKGMSGIELRHQLAQSGSNLPVVFISAIDDDAVRSKLTEVGCVAFFRKPFSADQLIGTLKKALSI